MATLSNNTVRLQLDTLSYDAPKDVLRKQWVQFWRCNDVVFQIGCFRGDELLDVSDFSTIYLSFRELDNGCPPSGGTPALLLGSTSTFDNTVTIDDWEAGTKQHAVIAFSAEENALAAGEYWMSIWAKTTNGKTITLGAGVCKINENGGTSTTPPDPIEIYYTAEECDTLLDKTLTNYYTVTECDAHLDEVLTDYYTAAECDTQFANYYTKTESDNRFERKGGGGGGGVAPVDKGTLAIGDGTETKILPAGTESQVLIADPSATYGAAWGDYPWRCVANCEITESVDKVLFEHIFDASRCKHYKILFDFVVPSIVSSRLLMQYGYDQDDEVYWESDAQEYNYSMADLAGTVAHYESIRWTTGYFAFGAENTSYRNNGGNLYGLVDIWNDGDISHEIQGRVQITSWRTYNGNLLCVNGIHSLLFKNAGQHVINSVKFMPESGTFDGGRFTVYGIH